MCCACVSKYSVALVTAFLSFLTSFVVGFLIWSFTCQRRIKGGIVEVLSMSVMMLAF